MRRLVLPVVGALVFGLGVTAGASPLCADQPEPSRWTADGAALPSSTVASRRS